MSKQKDNISGGGIKRKRSSKISDPFGVKDGGGRKLDGVESSPGHVNGVKRVKVGKLLKSSSFSLWVC